MKSAVILKSLKRSTPIYMWTAGRDWEVKDPDILLPESMWLSNQVGIQAGCFCAVDVDEFQYLLGRLPGVISELMLDTIEKVGFKDTSSISRDRWEKLYNPRPVLGDEPASNVHLYAVKGDDIFVFSCTNSGKGGWYRTNAVPDDYSVSFDMWDYEVFTKTGTVKLYGGCCKRLITSTLDNLYCYKKNDTVAKSYLVYAQSRIKSIWERRTSNEN